MMKNLVNHKNILVGSTVDNELVFANISIRENKIFSASFSIVTPSKIDNEYLYDVFSSLMEDLPKEELYNLCEQYNCSPSNLIDELFYYSNVEDILDISLFPEQIEINNDTWMFESAGVGQIETRNVMSEYIDKDCYMRLMTIWQDFHLKQIDNNTIQEVEMIIEKLNEVDQLQWIEDYIIENNYR